VIPKEVFIKIIPVLGSIILFLSWVFQQTLLGEANSALQRISSAQSVFQTYQSNNAMFNAIVETIKDDSESVDKIRRSQIYNYELGLRELESALDDEAKADIPSPPNPFSGAPDVETMMRITQERINTIQGKLAEAREKIGEQKAALSAAFLVLYALGSLTVLTGSALNVVLSARSSGGQSRTHKT
jgi:hypothetical protein